MNAVEQDRAHADEATILHSTTMEDGAMSHGDVVANDGGGKIRGDVQHAQILDVGARADPDRHHIPTHHGVEPHAGTLAHGDIADDEGSWCDVTGLVE